MKIAQTHDVTSNRLHGIYGSTGFRYARQMSDIYTNALIDAHKKIFLGLFTSNASAPRQLHWTYWILLLEGTKTTITSSCSLYWPSFYRATEVEAV